MISSALEKMIRNHGHALNVTKGDGYAPLHIAVVNGYEDVVNSLLQSVSFHFKLALGKARFCY